MQIANNTAVWLQYTLRDDAGEVLDASEQDEPLIYIHGQGDIVPGLEKALEGKAIGSKFKVSVPPEEGYGPREPGKVQSVPRSAFEDAGDLEPGMQFQAQADDGGVDIVTIVAVSGEEVTIDANHPLAGKQLHFEIEVVNVRDATEEELEHGHVHGPGGHHHH
ncbi:MAG TPA: peptidylprolyl isomerase [Polyangiales bacterium]|nr:peptidylprolyl isomerase [Polyangiales bacterium]